MEGTASTPGVLTQYTHSVLTQYSLSTHSLYFLLTQYSLITHRILNQNSTLTQLSTHMDGRHLEVSPPADPLCLDSPAPHRVALLSFPREHAQDEALPVT